MCLLDQFKAQTINVPIEASLADRRILKDILVHITEHVLLAFALISTQLVISWQRRRTADVKRFRWLPLFL